MTIKTIPVRLAATMPDNTPAVAAVVSAQLVDGRGVAAAFGVDGGVVVPWLVTGTTDSSGEALLHLWPNERGTDATLYRVIVKSGEIVLLNVTIAVPDSDALVELPIGQLINQPPWPAVSASQQALTQLQAAQAVLTQNVIDSEQAAADTDEDREAVVGERTATEQARDAAEQFLAQAQAAAAQGASYLNQLFLQFASATALSAALLSNQAVAAQAASMASQAQAAAAAANSVVQQDLSGVLGAPLHRSPNAVVCDPLIIDPAKDSNPLWPQQCGHTSWAKDRVLNGAWLDSDHYGPRGCPNELNARCYKATVGAEQITGADPTFGSAAGWSAMPAGWAIANGVLTITAGANNSTINTAATAGVNGGVYRLTVKIDSISGAFRVFYGANNNGGFTDFTAPGTYTVYFVSGAGAANVQLFALGASTTCVVDSISVKPVTAATTVAGSFYPNSTDGKFYTLNGTYVLGGALPGQTETFDGNSNVFGRMAVVAEAARVVLYAIDLPGRPMWMVFNTTANTTMLGLQAAQPTITSITYKDGWLTVGASNGAYVFDFAKDGFACGRVSSGIVPRNPGIANRNSQAGAGVSGPGGYILPNGTINAVAMTTMQDAPVDPATGLQVPTILLGTAGGYSLIQHDGTVRNSAAATAKTHVSLSQYMLTGYDTAFTNFDYALTPGGLGASFAVSSLTAASAVNFMQPNNTGRQSMGRRGVIGRCLTNAAQMNLLFMNEATPLASLGVRVTDTSNSGVLIGDARRAVLCDVGVGATGAEMSTDPGFNTPGAWLQAAVTGGTWTITGGQGVGSTVSGYLYQNLGVTVIPPSRLTRCTVTVSGYAGGSVQLFVGAGGNNRSPAISGNGTFTYDVLGDANGGQFGLLASGFTGNVDNISFGDVSVLDRSYKAKNLTVTGTLTKTAVATAAQLVAYSGFSAANYLQEVASTDLDPGTGTLRVGLWGTIPTNVAAAGWGVDRSAAAGAYYRLGHDATGKIVGELWDGTTTRTLTTATAYNSGQFIKAVMEYVPNGASSTLTIKVNGKQVAQSTFAALNTLSNAAALFTVGIDRALAAPWAGSLCMVKVGMTAASAEASTWIFDQERGMFRPGAQVTLPDSGTLVSGPNFDTDTATLTVASAVNDSQFNAGGTYRISTTPVVAGSITRTCYTDGIKLVARSTVNPGVDITTPSQNLREELARRAKDRREARPTKRQDFDVAAGQTKFSAQQGWEWQGVTLAGTEQREGSTKQWTRSYDGFVESIVMATGPATGAWLQGELRKAP